MKRISFKDSQGLELTQAVLAGRKTMTRRNTRMYKIGDVVAIQQAYKDIATSDGTHGYYKIGEHHYPQYELSGAGWKNKMFVRAELMPHHIRITAMHQERLQDISDEDCIREGITAKFVPYEDGRPGYDYTYDYDYAYYFNTPREAFASLIEKVSGRGTWESNPIVWVYEFELLP